MLTFMRTERPLYSSGYTRAAAIVREKQRQSTGTFGREIKGTPERQFLQETYATPELRHTPDSPPTGLMMGASGVAASG